MTGALRHLGTTVPDLKHTQSNHSPMTQQRDGKVTGLNVEELGWVVGGGRPAVARPSALEELPFRPPVRAVHLRVVVQGQLLCVPPQLELLVPARELRTAYS